MQKESERPWSRKPLLILPAIVLGIVGYWALKNRYNFQERLVQVQIGFASAGWKELCVFKDKFQAGGIKTSVTLTAPMLFGVTANNSLESSLYQPNLSDCSQKEIMVHYPRDGSKETPNFILSVSPAGLETTLIRYADPKTVLNLAPPAELHRPTRREVSDVPFVSDDGTELAWREPYATKYLIENILNSSKIWFDITGKVSKTDHAIVSIRPQEIIIAEVGSVSGYDRQSNRIWGPVKAELVHPMWGTGDLRVIGNDKPPQVVAWTEYSEKGPYRIISVRNGQTIPITVEAGYRISASDVSPDGKLMIIAAEDERNTTNRIFIFDLESGRQIFDQAIGGYSRPGVAFWSNDIVAVSIMTGRPNEGTAVFQKTH